MKRAVIALVVLAALLPAELFAVQPVPCKNDPRVLCVDYDEDAVLELTAFIGFQTTIYFAPNERIKDHGMGYSSAWTYTELTDKNGFFIKPSKLNPDTNLTVITSKHKYQFNLKMRDKGKAAPDIVELEKKEGKGKGEFAVMALPPNYIFSLKFRYPLEDAEFKLEGKVAGKASSQVKTDLETANRKKYRNNNYWLQGSEEIAPSAAWDNSTFTYFSFPPNMGLPNVYVVTSDGVESIVDRHMENDVVVVHTVARKFILRRGAQVAAVYNNSYDQFGIENATKTASQKVKREIVGADDGAQDNMKLESFDQLGTP